MVNTAGYEDECDHLVDDYSEWSVKLGRRGLDGVTQTGKHRIFRTIGTLCKSYTQHWACEDLCTRIHAGQHQVFDARSGLRWNVARGCQLHTCPFAIIRLRHEFMLWTVIGCSCMACQCCGGAPPVGSRTLRRFRFVIYYRV